jgi:hypothetical protein
VPGQQGSWRDEPVATQRGREQPATAARTARPAQSGLGRASWRRSTLTSWRTTMISASLQGLTAAQQDQPAEYPDHDQIQQKDRHKPRSCRNPLNLPNHRSQAARRVLEWYRCCSPEISTGQRAL